MRGTRFPLKRSTASLPRIVEDAKMLLQPTAGERRQALEALLSLYRLPVSRQEFQLQRGSETLRGVNLIVESPGIREDARVIIGAHYDAVELGDGTLSPGMVDNAAAVAVLARVARRLRDVVMLPRVQFVFFDLEEQGLLGSQHFVETTDTASVAAMINLDIAGYGDTLLYGPEASNALIATLRAVCAASGTTAVSFPQLPPSDDRSFLKAGIPSVSLAILPASEAHQLWLRLHGGSDSGLSEGFRPNIFQIIHSDQDTEAHLDAAAMTLAHDFVLNLATSLDPDEF